MKSPSLPEMDLIRLCVFAIWALKIILLFITISIKGFTINHLEGFGVEFGIDAVVFTVLGDEEFGVVGKRDTGAVVVEGTRLAVRDGKVRVCFNLNLLLPLPYEGSVDLALLRSGKTGPETLTGFATVGVELFVRCEEVPDYFE